MGKHVLLIEDEPNIIEAVSFLLRHDGWRVSTHSNGEDAVSVLAKEKPDVLILDVMLPNRSGYDILRDIRADDDLKSLPIMMLSAKGQAKDRQLALDFGADIYMTKPFSNDDMMSGVRKLAGQ